MAFVEGDGVLFAGDVVMNNSFVSANANSSTRAWLAAFESLRHDEAGLDASRRTARCPGSILQTLHTAVLGIQARARELKAQGKTSDETATAVQMEFQAKHPTWARVNGVAALARSAYAEAP